MCPISQSDLDPAALQAAVYDALTRAGTPAGRFVIDVRAECTSTNTALLALAEAGAPSGTALVAQHQSAGRGRRGRQWLSAPGDSLTFSLLWRFAPGTAPSGLSLAVGLALVQALNFLSPRAERGTALTLKWPNDVLLDGRKLAGVLVELVPGATHSAVIGIGLNRRLPDTLPPELRSVAAAWPAETPPEVLLAALLTQLARVFEQFSGGGFAVMREAWQQHHAHQDLPVSLHDDFTGPRHGLCRGVAADGALLLETEQGIERILSGDVSLRAVTP